MPVIRCLAGASPGAKPRCDIDFAATTRYGRSARGSPEPSTAATRQHDSQLLMKFTACRLRLRVHRGLCYAPQSCWAAVSSRATPRLTHSAIFIALLACESRGTGATFFHRLENEQRSLQKERRDGTSRRSVGIADAKGAQRAECPQPYRSILVPSLFTAFTLLCSVAERRSPLTHSLPLYTFYMFYTAILSAHSAPLR